MQYPIDGLREENVASMAKLPIESLSNTDIEILISVLMFNSLLRSLSLFFLLFFGIFTPLSALYCVSHWPNWRFFSVPSLSSPLSRRGRAIPNGEATHRKRSNTHDRRTQRQNIDWFFRTRRALAFSSLCYTRTTTQVKLIFWKKVLYIIANLEIHIVIFFLSNM